MRSLAHELALACPGWILVLPAPTGRVGMRQHSAVQGERQLRENIVYESGLTRIIGDLIRREKI